MPWKENSVMDERMKFIAKLLDGEQMSSLCREFGISRKTGYKIYNRYKDCGVSGLGDRSRRPIRVANKLPFQIEKTLLKIKKEKPHWGAAKIREIFRRRYPDVRTPAVSTIHVIFDKNGLVKRRRKRNNKYKAKGTHLSTPKNPNQLWCADYKGQFMLGNKKYCYPLTVTDQVSRYIIACEGLENNKEKYALSTFERVFKEYGLPEAIRTDNGVPFASANGLFGLSKMSVWWLRLGINVERIKPGNPQQNGQHERMHLTLKQETTRPAASNLFQQQGKFYDFIDEFNNERPHQALDMKSPVQVYTKAKKQYKGIQDIDYPFHDTSITITNCGRICFDNNKIHLSQVFAGQEVGIKQVDDITWLVSFMEYDLGYFDLNSRRFNPLVNPFGAKVLPMSSE